MKEEIMNNPEENRESNDKKKTKKMIVIIISIILLIGSIVGVFAAINNREDDKPARLYPYPSSGGGVPAVDKPIIYLYPETTTEVKVSLGVPENLTHTYPKYESGWNVIAEPNGNLIDINTGRSLYALYWEGINTVEPKMNEGFVVKGSDIIEFLEEKLEQLGLNEREANEFIIYWLPQMENNEYNFIRFQTMEEINENMPLNIEPKPDTIIRVVMEWKPLEEYIEIPEQQLKTPTRTGFTVVEWGGTEIK